MHEFVYVYVLIYQKMFRKINYVLVAFSECSFVVGVRALFFTVHKVFSGQPTSIMGFSSTRTEREEICSSKSVETLKALIMATGAVWHSGVHKTVTITFK